MSIVELKKVTLCGLANEKTAVLEALQSLGCLHLTSLRPPPEPDAEMPEHATDLRQALAYLMAAPVKRHQMTESLLESPHDDEDNGERDGESGFDLPAIVSRTLELKRRERELQDRHDFLGQRIRELEPWGDFRLPPEEDLAGYRLWFYLAPLRQLKSLPRHQLAWQEVHRDSQHAYIVAIAREEPPPGAMPVPRVHTGAVSPDRLRHALRRNLIEQEEVAAEREALTCWISLLTRNLAQSEDHAALSQAADQTFDTDGLFALQGWLPAPALEALRRLTEGRQLALLVEAPQPGDAPPTLLENPGPFGGGADLVRFYQTPAYGGWDPSAILFGSFVLFFAMILSDAGYGLVLALALLLGWSRLGHNPLRRRLRVLATALVIATLGWGALTGSYFGAELPPDSLLARLKVLDLQDFNAMMRLSVVIGALHIALANAALAWHRRHRPDAVASLGWVASVFGGLALAYGRDTVVTAGAILLTLGLLAVLGGNIVAADSRKPGLAGLLRGLAALAGVSRMFGDILSYLRLFALGLASASLALTLNQLADQVYHSVPGIGFLLSLVILLLGHGLNLALAVMSGVVHGLRLNFIEFFNWGLTGEGYPFRPFAKTSDAAAEKGPGQKETET